MKKGKKLALLLVVCLIVTTVFAGCASKTSNNETGKPIVIKWVARSAGVQVDSQKVWGEFNKQLNEKLPGVQVEFEPIANADYAEKWKLMAASGEEIDIAWTGWLIPYSDEVKKSAFKPLDELIDKYAPNLKAALPEFYWDLATVDGKIYSVPCRQNVTDMRYGIRVHKELAEKYWDTEKAKNVFYSNKTMTKECYDVIEEYLAKLKENGEIRKGVSTFFPATGKGYYSIYDIFSYSQDDPTCKVANMYEMPEMKLYFDTMADWYKKGYIRPDALSLGGTARQDEGKEDGYVIWMHNTLENTAETETKKYNYPIDIVPMNKNYTIGSLQSNDALVIPRTSKNPEAAIKLIDLLYSDDGKDLLNLLVYGNEGEHYKTISENRIETLDYTQWPTKDSKYGMYTVAMGNTFNLKLTQAEPDGYFEMLEKLENESIKSPLLGFKPNNESFKNELAHLNVVINEYRTTLRSGSAPDHEKVYNEFVQKMKKAGSDKIVEELNKQITEFLSNKK